MNAYPAFFFGRSQDRVENALAVNAVGGHGKICDLLAGSDDNAYPF